MEERVVLGPYIPPVRCINTHKMGYNGTPTGKHVANLTLDQWYYPSKEDSHCYLLVDSECNGTWYSKWRFTPTTLEYNPNQQGDLDDDI